MNSVTRRYEKLKAKADIERKGAIYLTKSEAKAALNAIGQMTTGNARDYDEWKLQTHGTRKQWKSLLQAEAKIAALIGTSNV